MQGSEWQRLCLLGMSTASASDAVVSSQSGGGGSVKVREMTDLLGVSNSLIFPPLRSSLWEKGLNRAGGAKVAGGGVSGGWSMSDLLRERRWSNSRPRDRLRTGLTGGEVASKSRIIVLVYRSETEFSSVRHLQDGSPLTAGSAFCFLSACFFSSSATIWEKDGRSFAFICQITGKGWKVKTGHKTGSSYKYTKTKMWRHLKHFLWIFGI